MTPVSQIVWKNRQKLSSHKALLLVNPPADGLALNLQNEGFTLTALCHSHASHTQLSVAGIRSHFAVTMPRTEKLAQIVLFQPREKPLLEMMLALCGGWLEDGGELWLAGANRAGIRSAGKRLASHFGTHRKVDSARHCGLFMANSPTTGSKQSMESFTETWTFESAQREWSMASLPGVFAHGRLDDGSRLLLDTLTSDDLRGELNGRILDFACGAGVIGIPLAGLRPDTDVTLLDDSAIALESAERSLEANGVKAELIASDGLTEVLNDACPRFDWIVSNPPFHSGVQTNTEIAERFFRESSQVMNPGGRLCLVSNVHLPYGRWLQELFDSVQVIATDRGYNIWLAQ